MKQFKLVTLLFLTLILTYSCTEDDSPTLPLGDYEKGYFITNEGSFQNGSGTLTFVDEAGDVTQSIFKAVNHEDLGSVVQSMALHGDFAYIVVNNSHKVKVANRYTMKNVATIEGDSIKNPRHFVVVGTTGYISNWGDTADATDDYIAVVDLATNTVTNKIPVGEGPEDMLVDGTTIYVNLQGGWGQNNKVEVIDVSTNTVTSTLEVGDVPNAIVKGNNGVIWVLCGGKPSFTGAETNGQLAKIENNEVTLLDFGTAIHPKHLTIDGDSLYYGLSGKVYAMSTTATELPTTELTGLDGAHYSLKAHDGKLYATDAGDFQSEGSVKVYDLNDNSLKETIITGINPGSVVFQ